MAFLSLKNGRQMGVIGGGVKKGGWLKKMDENKGKPSDGCYRGVGGGGPLYIRTVPPSLVKEAALSFEILLSSNHLQHSLIVAMYP